MTIKSLVTVTVLDHYIVGGYSVDTERGDYKWYTDVRNCNSVFFFFHFSAGLCYPHPLYTLGLKPPRNERNDLASQVSFSFKWCILSNVFEGIFLGKISFEGGAYHFRYKGRIQIHTIISQFSFMNFANFIVSTFMNLNWDWFGSWIKLGLLRLIWKLGQIGFCWTSLLYLSFLLYNSPSSYEW